MRHSTVIISELIQVPNLVIHHGEEDCILTSMECPMGGIDTSLVNYLQRVMVSKGYYVDLIVIIMFMMTG